MEVALLLSAVDLKVVVIMVILLGVMMIKIKTSAGPVTAAPVSRNPPTTEKKTIYTLLLIRFDQIRSRSDLKNVTFQVGPHPLLLSRRTPRRRNSRQKTF